MSASDHERYRQHLEEQLRADVELLFEGYRARLRAYEAIHGLPPEGSLSLLLPEAGPAVSLPAVPAVPSVQPVGDATSATSAAVPRPRSGANELYSASLKILDQLPEVFDKNDLCRILGYSPHRASLHRLFRDLVKNGRLDIEDPRGGRWPIRYRRLSSPSSTPG